MTARLFDTGVANAVAHLPDPPEYWSYSTLKEVELCPRRYALGKASYPALWDGIGYPYVPNPAALFGEVVHDSLDQVIRALVKAGCTSSNSEKGVAILRKLGGYTAVIEDALARQLQRLDGNPRVDGEGRERLEHQLERRIPEARTQVQSYLQRMSLAPRTSTEGTAGSRLGRRPLGPGSHPEVSLQADELRIKGRVDLLSITDTKAHIVDYKTGTEDPTHLDQLRFYALLWSRDEITNASRMALGTLTASYPSTEVTISPPDASELATLAETTMARVVKADNELNSARPVAAPGEHCSFCSVRGLCDRYWQDQAPKPSDLPNGVWFDFDGVVGQRNGPHSWWLIDTRAASRLLLRTTSSQELVTGQRLRFLSIRREVELEDETAAALFTSNSEAVVVSSATATTDR